MEFTCNRPVGLMTPAGVAIVSSQELPYVHARFITQDTICHAQPSLFVRTVVMAVTSTVDIPHDRLASALQRARDYLLEKQSPGGGFCFYRGYYLEEPNLADTWHGVAALTGLLGVELSKPKEHADFVIGQAVESQPLGLYYRVRSLLALHTSDPAASKVARAVAALPLDLPDSARPHLLGSALRRLHYVLWLRQHLGMNTAAEDIAKKVLAMANDDGGYGVPSNLLDTADAIAVLSLCGVTAPAITGQFVTSMADPQFGFRLVARFPSSSLETVHAGAASCRRLDLAIPYVAAATDFVLSCQSGRGGFARASGALPDMTLTYMALTTLLCDLSDRSIPADVSSRAGAG